MARFQPFLGLRYDDEVASPSEVIAPPYDVIDEAERRQLADRSPYNAVHVELPVDDVDRYAKAAEILASWQHDGALRRDDVPSLYAYRMRYTDETGTERSTLGVIGALGIDAEGSGQVLPHERTMPKPKGDRLDLLRATGVNTSPIWALSLSAGLGAACARAIAAHTPFSATDDDGVVHELSPIVDENAISAIVKLVEATPVVIADGHHRYETATFFREETRAANGDAGGLHDFVMALVVELAPQELFVDAIHRLVSGLPDDLDLVAALEPYFAIEEGPSDPAELVLAGRVRGALGLILRDRNWLLVPLASVEAEADLDSSRLDVALASLPAHELVYQHGARNIADAVARGHAQAGVILRPATVAQIADTAHGGVRMPPKTTFFTPKPRTGFVYREARQPEG